MLRLLQSIFTSKEINHGYPESLVKGAIERAVEGQAPCLRLFILVRKIRIEEISDEKTGQRQHSE